MSNERFINRDYYLLIDKSGSMTTADCAGGKTRWQVMQEYTQAFANQCAQFDPDGITVIPFAGSFKVYENTTPSAVEKIFKEQSAMGSTELDAPLTWVFEKHLALKFAGTLKANGSLVVVVTDGQPNDKNALKQTIVNFTKKMDKDEECAVLFLQIGQDTEAAKFLAELDDELVGQYGAKFDIVDTKTAAQVENMSFEEILNAALDD